MTIIESIKQYIATCPYLEENSTIHYNGTDLAIGDYSLDSIAEEIIEKQYLSGDSIRVYPFKFTFSGSMADDAERLNNNVFMENFVAWLESQSKNGILPNLGSNKDSFAINAVKWGYFNYLESPITSGKYQIECKLFYYQKGN